MIRLIGNPVSPYVRKVMLALDAKALDYELDPITPFLGSAAFERLSPLRRIPVLIDGDLVVNDSTVICEYLAEAYPGAPLYPLDPAERSRARWLEEYADSRMGDVMIWKLFFQRVAGPLVLKREPDEAKVAEALESDLPRIMDWLEAQAPAEGFRFGDAALVPDWIVASMFRNATLAGWTPDGWPKTVALVARVQATPAFRRTVEIDSIIRSTPRRDLVAALALAGMRVSAETVGGREPMPGVMGAA